jgi:cell division septation protein DedD
MKRSIIAVLAVAVLFSMTGLSGAQEKPSPTFKIKVTAEQANIRDTPDIGSPVVQQLPEGSVLEAEKKQGEWYLVRFTRDDGLVARGYIHESLVAELEAVPSVPVEKIRVEPVKKVDEKPEPAAVEPARQEPARPDDRPAPPPSAPRPVPAGLPEAKIFGFSVLAGANFAAVGDLNTGARGLADYYSAVLGITGTGNIAGLHLTYILGGEISYSLMPGLFATFGLDYFAGRRSSHMEFAAGVTPDVLRTRPRVQAVPVKLGLAYYPLPYAYLKGGLQYYFVSASYLYRTEKNLYWQEWQGNAKARGIGASIGAGGEYEFFPGLFLVGEAEFRFARFGGFTGKDITINSEGESYTEQGTLYYFLAEAAGQGSYPLVFIRSDLPTESGAREARVNLTGISLKFGIRVRF